MQERTSHSPGDAPPWRASDGDVAGPPRTETPYTCPMHPDVRRAGPGACPKCGMELEPISPTPGRLATERVCPAHPEIDAGLEDASSVGGIDWSLHRALRARAAAWGALAGALLVAVYAGTLAAANSLEHALDDFLGLWFWMVPLVLGFALQVGLFAYGRRAVRAGPPTARARGVVASGGASTVSMIACCAHHLTDVLPIVGLAGAATLLATHQVAFLLLGVLSNVVGLVYVLGLLRRHGLHPRKASLLSIALRWPVDRALLPTIALSVAVFVAVLLARTS